LNEPVSQLQAAVERVDGRLGSAAELARTLEQSLNELRRESREGTALLDQRLREQGERIQEGRQAVGQVLEELKRMRRPFQGVLASGLALQDSEPEPNLLQYLAGEVSARTAVDVGANEGRFAERLYEVGLRVVAMEPGPEAHARLLERAASREGFQVVACAAGAYDGEGQLRTVVDTTEDQRYAEQVSLYASLAPHELVDGLAFQGGTPVRVRRLSSLAEEGLIPRDIGILKIDTEGCDLDVIEGLGTLRPEVVQVEFWDPEFVFARTGARNAVGQTAPALRALGYGRHIVIARMPAGQVVHYCNLPVSIPGTWGNAIFFREEAPFQAAKRWCEATITPAYLYR
jgi:FkbM family methyltransferase